MTTTETIDPPNQHEPQLLGQTIVVIDGSAGIGLETSTACTSRGPQRHPDWPQSRRLQHAASEGGAQSTATFDANDLGSLETFLADLQGPIDQVMVTAGGPYYAPWPRWTSTR
jgi:hypothetical protein